MQLSPSYSPFLIYSCFFPRGSGDRATRRVRYTVGMTKVYTTASQPQSRSISSSTRTQTRGESKTLQCPQRTLMHPIYRCIQNNNIQHPLYCFTLCVLLYIYLSLSLQESFKWCPESLESRKLNIFLFNDWNQGKLFLGDVRHLLESFMGCWTS